MDLRKRIFFSIVGSTTVVLLISLYNQNRSTKNNLIGPKISYVEEVASERSTGNDIWPKLLNERNDRIFNQVRFSIHMNESGQVPVNTTNIKVVYHLPHRNYGDPPPEGQYMFLSQQSQHCPIQACRITRKSSEIKSADAVFIQGFTKYNLKDLLPKSRNQVWIVHGGEAPPLNSDIRLIDTSSLGDLVNWTMFYRRDATIPTPYGKFHLYPNFTRIEDYPVPDGMNYAAGRKKKVAWFVSNCNFGVNSGRGNYAKELSKYIDVDIYGQCGTMKCPKEDYGKCFDMIKDTYKFYLSFENNCCKDYITEKLFHNALWNDLIPIVLGASPEDYKAVAPPASYIHVDDFESPQQLAEYLHLLDKNDTLYNEYFRWKRTGQFLTPSHWCRLCALLHAKDKESYVHWYSNFQEWWDGKGICLPKARSGEWQSWRRS